MSTVIGTIIREDGTPYVGAVRFVPIDVPIVSSAKIVVGSGCTVTTDEDGAFEATLKVGRYKVTAIKSWNIAVPDDAGEYNILSLVTDGLNNLFIPIPGASGPTATADVSGTVKTNTTSTDPVVYLADEVDGLISSERDALETVMASKQPRMGAVKLYNPDTNKWHAVYLSGTGDECHLVVDPTGEA